MIRDMVREWVDEEVIPKLNTPARKAFFPDEWRVALGEMGVLGAPLKGYGCGLVLRCLRPDLSRT